MDKMDLNELINLEDCAAAFGTGKTAGRLIDEIIDKEPDLQAEEEYYGTPAVRKRIGEFIRVANPATTNFSEKYRIAFENAREAAISTLKPLMQVSYNNLAEVIENLNMNYLQLRESIEKLIEGAHETKPTGAGEFINMVNLLLKVDAARIDNAEKCINIFERLQDLLSGDPID